MFSLKPPAEFHHPHFGKFECEGDLWTTPVRQGSRFIVFYQENHPDDFTFTFAMAGDVDSIWRVEFVSNAPRFTGRDD